MLEAIQPNSFILQARRFSANGELNFLARRRRESKVRVTADGEFHTELADECWDPRSLLGILDGSPVSNGCGF